MDITELEQFAREIIEAAQQVLAPYGLDPGEPAVVAAVAGVFGILGAVCGGLIELALRRKAVQQGEPEGQQQEQFEGEPEEEAREELAPEILELKAPAELQPTVSASVLRAQHAVELPEPGIIAEASSVRGGLQKTRAHFFSRLFAIFSKGETLAQRESLFSELEELLITSDMGVKTTERLLSSLRQRFSSAERLDLSLLQDALRADIEGILESAVAPEIVPEKRDGLPMVLVVVGVNGVGKTTTIGKLAFQFCAQGKKVLIAACDTFRAAAVAQLDVWASRAGAEIHSGSEHAKPSTVAYEAVHRARQENFDVLIIDTAGRLHTRVNLMNELNNVIKLIEREQPGSPHEVVLVLDASTGQNALQQAREFNAVAGLSGIIITKLDGTPKGGIVVAIKEELGVPVRYIGVGESVADLKLFSPSEFAAGLFELAENTPRVEVEAVLSMPVEGVPMAAEAQEVAPEQGQQVRRRRRFEQAVM